MAKLVEEGEMAMGIAEESEWLGNIRRIGELDGLGVKLDNKSGPELDAWKNVNFKSVSAIW